MATWSILVGFFLESVSSIKIGSYNTFQIPSNPIASSIIGPQLTHVGASDIDVLCLQELTFPHTIQGYTQALNGAGFTHSFSTLDVWKPEDLDTPRTPCNSEELSAITSECATTYCNAVYPMNAFMFVGCFATYCPAEFAKILYDDCFGCFFTYLTLQPQLAAWGLTAYSLDVTGASLFCGNPPPPYNSILYNLTDGAVIMSRTNY
eukprot:236830_1